MKNHFRISKSACTRAFEHLSKDGLITEDKDAGTISLVEKDDSDTDNEG